MAGALELADGHLLSERTRDVLIEVIPPNTTTAIALVEHIWAKPLKEAIARAGGMEIDNDWLRLDELVAMGLRGSLALGDLEEEGVETYG